MSVQTQIKRLDNVVVNRIAAGEVIQRPANAVKELLENSIDAGSSSISITVKDGGLQYLQVLDNGCGIRKDDLEIVCERFTTSKICAFNDLTTLQSFGFRGEALASISHIAHLTIQSRSIHDAYTWGYKACYCDSRLKGAITPCSSNYGTIITAEDLFFNLAHRKNALANTHREYMQIYEIVSKYAIHYNNIGFNLMKRNDSNDLRTRAGSTRRDNIGYIYGSNVTRDLIDVNCSDDDLKFEMTGFITNLNYSGKKMETILFINNRLVSSTTIRKVIAAVYSELSPKEHAFVYMDIRVDPKNCDVNVHPTKHEIQFLHEEEIGEKIRSTLMGALMLSDSFKTSYKQTRLIDSVGVATKELCLPESSHNKTVEQAQKCHAKDLVRTDADQPKLQKFFGETTKSLNNTTSENDTKTKHKPRGVLPRKHNIEVKLKSVHELRQQIEKTCDDSLRELFAHLIFVGNVDEKSTLVQYDTNFYILNNNKIAKELFYQFLIYNFQNFDQFHFKTPYSTRELLDMSAQFPEVQQYFQQINSVNVDDVPKISEATSILISKSKMLKTYFEFEIDEAGMLIGMPMLINDYLPDLTNLPVLLFNLVFMVDWDDEKECFRTFSRQLAEFYANQSCDDGMQPGWQWVLEHAFYPEVKRYFLPPQEFQKNGSVMRLTSLPELYKVFERC